MMCTMSDGKYDKSELQQVAERAAGVYHEKMKHELGMVLEAVADLRKKADTLDEIKADVAELKNDNKLFKQVLKDTNYDLQNHEQRITKLETVARD